MKTKKPTPTIPTPEEAFRSSELYEFAGQKLEPFSFLRQSALISLSIEMGGIYATEIAVAMWLMTRPDDIARKARRSPSSYIEEIDQFAEENGLGAVIGDRFQEARAIFEQIQADLKATKGVPQSQVENDDEGDTDPN